MHSLLVFFLRCLVYDVTCFRIEKEDDVSSPLGDANAHTYDAFSETQTESQVSALTHFV